MGQPTGSWCAVSLDSLAIVQCLCGDKFHISIVHRSVIGFAGKQVRRIRGPVYRILMCGELREILLVIRQGGGIRPMIFAKNIRGRRESQRDDLMVEMHASEENEVPGGRP